MPNMNGIAEPICIAPGPPHVDLSTRPSILDDGSTTTEFVKKNMTDAHIANSMFEVLSLAINTASATCGPITKMLVLEFGVFKGISTNYIANLLPYSTVYGFDSFKGLPEDWRDGFPAGTFEFADDTYKLLKLQENIRLVVGWFDETLPSFIEHHTEPIALLHIDADLYSSAKTIFNLLKNQIVPGTVIVFDEYFNYPGWEEGEHKAFTEFIEETNRKFRYLTYNNLHEQVAVQIL